jgi:hypothetical protein
MGRGGGGQGQHGSGADEGELSAQAQEGGAEVVAPLRETVRLIHAQQRHAAIAAVSAVTVDTASAGA